MEGTEKLKEEGSMGFGNRFCGSRSEGASGRSRSDEFSGKWGDDIQMHSTLFYSDLFRSVLCRPRRPGDGRRFFGAG